MPRNHKRSGGRRFDTRLTMFEIIRIIRPTPRQKITILRYMKKRLKGGEQQKSL